MNSTNDCPRFAWIFLIFIGAVDLFRGFMHTVLLPYSAAHIAGLDLSCSGGDQLQLLGAFGISNWLTGMLFIAIGLRARHLVPSTLLFIVISYAIGLVFVHRVAYPTVHFPGRYFMMVYLLACLIVLCGVIIAKNKVSKAKA